MEISVSQQLEDLWRMTIDLEIQAEQEANCAYVAFQKEKMENFQKRGIGSTWQIIIINEPNNLWLRLNMERNVKRCAIIKSVNPSPLQDSGLHKKFNIWLHVPGKWLVWEPFILNFTNFLNAGQPDEVSRQSVKKHKDLVYVLACKYT